MRNLPTVLAAAAGWLRGKADYLLSSKRSCTWEMESFAWNSAPFNHIRVPLLVGGIYIAVCLVHRLWHGRSPTPSPYWHYLQGLLPYHNLFLAAISLVMFIGCGWSAFEKSWRLSSIDWMLCEDPEVPDTGSLEFWSYIYYLSKFYELFDTFFQLLRGKYPPHYLLHAYHHSGVLMMCWAWLEYRPSLRHFGLIFNVFVHIPMYFYFFLKSRNIEPWWKRYVTKLQIVQFVTSLVLFVCTWYQVTIRGRQCNSMSYLYAQLVFNTSLLLGFIGVLQSGKKKNGTAGKKEK